MNRDSTLHRPAGGGIIPTRMPSTPGLRTELDVWAMISGFPTNLRYVTRFSCSRCLRPENVAEHSWFVVFYSLLIADWCVRNDRIEFPSLNLEGGPDAAEVLANQQQAFLGVVLAQATIHDVEEARSGDIHRPFKYSTPELKAALDASADVAAQQVFGQLYPLEDVADDGSSPLRWLHLWSRAKDKSTYAGLIVRFADYLSVLSYVIQEGPDAVYRLCLDTMEGQFSEMEADRYDFIRPLVDAAARLSKDVFHARRQAVNPG